MIFVHPSRLSRDEKVFSRQLEEAIKASKIESSDGDEGRSESQESVVPASKTVVSEPPKSTSKGSKVDDDEFVPDKTTCSSIESSEEEEESYSAADEDEDSDFSMSPEPKKGRKGARESAKSAPKGKKTAVKKATSVKSEKVTAKSSSRKITKSQAVKVKSEAQNLPANVPKTLSVCIDKKASVPVGRATGHGTSPAVLGVNKRAVNWTPPSRIGESNTKNGSCTPIPTRVQSGGGGTPLIRVGLSRNARVKSLHTNIKTCT